MKRRIVWFAIALLGILPMAVQAAPPVNSLNKQPYVFFDRADSTLAFTAAGNPSAGTGTADILDTFPPGPTGSNRHDALLSNDGGATAQTFSIDDSYTFSTILNLSTTANSPRKEAGIRINSPVTGDALFIVNSDAGEIVTFGGGAPFHLFGNNGGGNGYTPGTNILLGFTMVAFGDGSGVGQNKIDYFIDRDPSTPGVGVEHTGLLDWSNLEGGPLNYNVGVYLQGGMAQGIPGSMHAVYTKVTYGAVPEPATCVLSLVGCIGLAFVRRRNAR
jgi:hypothetical protein